LPRICAHHLQKAIWVLNRRDCWAYAQAKAPFGVKQLVWQHEEDELGGDVARGLEDHYALNISQGKAVGLTPQDFAEAQPTDTLFTCMTAWISLAKDSPWLKSLASCAALELTNSEEVLRGKSASRRMAENVRDDLGIEIGKQQSYQEHMVADIEHANILMRVARDHAHSALARTQILEGVEESWAIDRVFRGHLADLMESISE
jgi:pyrroloquinoline quinone (PQQ) biosynthesis protein C